MSTLGPYELNTIVTGDARKLAQAIPDESVDLVLTDPPFGIDFKYSNGYVDDPRNYTGLVRWVISHSDRVIKPGGYIFVFQSMKKIRETWRHFPKNSLLFAACKSFVQGGNNETMKMFDPVVYWKKEGCLLPDDFRRDWHVGNTAYTNQKRENNFHDCPRPLDTITYMVEKFCPIGGVVLDLFMGSGTTAKAAVITGRNYLGFELDPATAERARARVANTQPPLFVPEHTQLKLT